MGVPCAGADSSAHTRAFGNGHVSFQFCSRSGRGGGKQLHGLHPQVSLPKKQGAALTWAWPRRVINPEARPLTLLSHFPGAAKAISNSRVGCSHILSAPGLQLRKGCTQRRPLLRKACRSESPCTIFTTQLVPINYSRPHFTTNSETVTV